MSHISSNLKLVFISVPLLCAFVSGCTTIAESGEVATNEVQSVPLQTSGTLLLSEGSPRENKQAALRSQSTAFRLLNRGLLAPAEREFRKALDLDSSLLRSIYGLGRVHMQRESFALAEAMFDKVLEADVNDLEALNALGVLYDRQERHTESREIFQRALIVDPEFVKAINNLGFSYFVQGQLESAQEQYSKAVAIDPEYDPAWLNLALLHFQRGDQTAAFESFVKVYPPHRALNNLGYLNFLKGEVNLARENFTASVNSTDQYYLDAVKNLELLDTPASDTVHRESIAQQVITLLGGADSGDEDITRQQSIDDKVDDDTLLGR